MHILEEKGHLRRRESVREVIYAPRQTSESLGETQSFVSKCERGERRLDLIQLRGFCSAFGIDLKQFVGAFEIELASRRGVNQRELDACEPKSRYILANMRHRAQDRGR